MQSSAPAAKGRLSRADLEAVLNLVRMAYEGLSCQEAWLEMLRQVRTLFKARDAWLIRIPVASDSTSLLLAPEVDPGILRAYSGTERKGCFTNPAMKVILEQGIDGVINTTEVFPWQEIERTEYFDVIRRPRGVRWEVGAARLHGRDSLRFMTVNRARAAPRFGAREEALLQALLPHIVEVLRIDDQRAGAKARESQLRAAVNQLKGAAFFLGTTGALRALDEKAEKLLRSERLPKEVTAAGTFPDTSLSKFLQECRDFLERVGDHEGTPPVKPTSRTVDLVHGGRGKVESDLRFENGMIAGILVSVRLEVAGASDVEPELAPWGFTPRERDVAHSLLAGARGGEICRVLGISRETLKTHLRHLNEKTETQGRIQLVARLYRRSGH